MVQKLRILPSQIRKSTKEQPFGISQKYVETYSYQMQWHRGKGTKSILTKLH